MGISTLIKRRAIFLDRDGVLNHAVLRNGKPYPPSHLSELTIPNDVYPAISLLKSTGFLLIGATNQPDVARGTTTREAVEAINNHLIETLQLDEIRTCYHDDNDNCFCRKPLPGLLTQAAIDHHIDLAGSVMIGDRWKDIEAGKEAGCITIWLRSNTYQEKAPPRQPDFIALSMTEASEWIMKNTL
jgi:D-glycero-D-manno-heptose 1,7-bisphosphate phosphatase